MELPPIRRLLRSALVLSVAGALGACKGAGQISWPQPVPGGAGVLSSYFVQSFAPYEALAAQLRDSTARYTVQNSNWYFPVAPTVTYDSYPLASAHIEYAHAVGLTGAGQTVAVIDDGFLTTHEAFAGKAITRTGSPAIDDHGTGVASVIAGNSAHMIGVAPGASLHIADFYNTGTMAAATQQALALGAVAQNNSWTFAGLLADSAGFQSAFSGTGGQAYLTALDAYAAQGVAVFAVSNDSLQTRSLLMEALPTLRPTLETGWLAVANAVPVFTSAGISSARMISSGCLQAARWCLVADGAWESAAAAATTAYQFSTGSSFAAPQVSGSLALLAEAFPGLSPHELRLRLLASADNSFFAHDGTIQLAAGFSHGYTDTYGHGFLDLRAALLPIGATIVSMPGGRQVAANQPLIVTGAALGDAVAQSLAEVRVAVSDSLNGGFQMPGAALVATSAPAPMAAGLLAHAVRTDLAAARLSGPAAVTAAFSAHPGQVLDLTASDGSAAASVLLPSGAGGAGLALTRTMGDGATRFDVGVTLARDAGAVIGFGGAAATSGRSGMIALRLGLAQDLAGGGFLSLGGEIGVADLGAPAWLSEVSTARFDSLSLEIGQRNALTKGDRLSLGVSLPMAVTSGSAEIALPVALASGAAQVQPVGLNLAPADRQIDLALTWRTPLGPGGELMLTLVHAENHGNRAGISDTAAVLAYTFRF